MNSQGGLQKQALASATWCCVFKKAGDSKVRQRVVHTKVSAGEEEVFLVKCKDEILTYLQEHMPPVVGKHRVEPGSVVANFGFFRGKRPEDPIQLPYSITLAQLLQGDLGPLHKAFLGT